MYCSITWFGFSVCVCMYLKLVLFKWLKYYNFVPVNASFSITSINIAYQVIWLFWSRLAKTPIMKVKSFVYPVKCESPHLHDYAVWGSDTSSQVYDGVTNSSLLLVLGSGGGLGQVQPPGDRHCSCVRQGGQGRKCTGWVRCKRFCWLSFLLCVGYMCPLTHGLQRQPQPCSSLFQSLPHKITTPLWVTWAGPPPCVVLLMVCFPFFSLLLVLSNICTAMSFWELP